MYNENSFISYINGLKIKKVMLMIFFSIAGAILGVFLSDLIINVLLFSSIPLVAIITLSTLLFFGISLLLTSNINKNIQDSYWKIAVLRKLTVISKKLDNLEDLDNSEKIELKKQLHDTISSDQNISF